MSVSVFPVSLLWTSNFPSLGCSPCRGSWWWDGCPVAGLPDPIYLLFAFPSPSFQGVLCHFHRRPSWVFIYLFFAFFLSVTYIATGAPPFQPFAMIGGCLWALGNWSSSAALAFYWFHPHNFRQFDSHSHHQNHRTRNGNFDLGCVQLLCRMGHRPIWLVWGFFPFSNILPIILRQVKGSVPSSPNMNYAGLFFVIIGLCQFFLLSIQFFHLQWCPFCACTTQN